MDDRKLNDYVRQESNGSWEDCKWQEWASTELGAVWYIPLSDTYPQNDNVLEGETGDLMYLSADDAYIQWCGTELGSLRDAAAHGTKEGELDQRVLALGKAMVRRDYEGKYDWEDNPEAWPGDDEPDDWEACQYYVNSGIVAKTEEAYYLIAEALGVDRDKAEGLLESWKQWHYPDDEGWPVNVGCGYGAEWSVDGEIVRTEEDPTQTVDGTGSYSLYDYMD